ncbi:MAG: ABC transporter permease [Spirochaetes bacterium]|jgi:phospholipid/cholesterol/gamma-HCH transport system permease protein|nr:ABC transporter permease [Spirochaetota bacterium]
MNSFLKGTMHFFEEFGQYAIFFKETIRWIFKTPFDFRNLMHNLLEIGYKSIPVTSITIFFTGMVMALQIGNAMEAQMPGSSIYIGSAVTIAMFRELAPVLTALLLAGRVGSAIAAQIGTMKVTEQIDALITLSANPVQYLSVPRFLSCIIMTPALTVISDFVGVSGGAFIGYFALDISLEQYLTNVIKYTSSMDFLSGIIKSFFFGIEISIIATFEGFKTTGGAEGVGKSTITAVVKSSMVILISDYFFTYILQMVG